MNTPQTDFCTAFTDLEQRAYEVLGAFTTLHHFCIYGDASEKSDDAAIQLALSSMEKSMPALREAIYAVFEAHNIEEGAIQ